MVTSSPPENIPRAKLREKSANPKILATPNKIQLDRVTNLMIRCWMSKMSSPFFLDRWLELSCFANGDGDVSKAGDNSQN